MSKSDMFKEILKQNLSGANGFQKQIEARAFMKATRNSYLGAQNEKRFEEIEKYYDTPIEQLYKKIIDENKYNLQLSMQRAERLEARTDADAYAYDLQKPLFYISDYSRIDNFTPEQAQHYEKEKRNIFNMLRNLRKNKQKQNDRAASFAGGISRIGKLAIQFAKGFFSRFR